MQRLRIINLLYTGPLCVCHIEEILEADQVKVSKQLHYMKRLGVVQSERVAQWMVYSLTDRSHLLISTNVESLRQSPELQNDLSIDNQKRQMIEKRIKKENPACCGAMAIS